MQNFKLEARSGLPITKQIMRSVVMDIEKGHLGENEQLMSINLFSKQHKIARDTVEKAYVRLKADGYITSVRGKGYYSLDRRNKGIRVLFIFDKLSFYKKMTYDAFVTTLGQTNLVDVFIHHNSPELLKEKLENNVGNYDYYVIMPHFFYHLTKVEQHLKVLNMIPGDQLILLDKNIPQLNSIKGAVYQDLEHDIYKILYLSASLFKKYRSINIVLPNDGKYPVEICLGIDKFCREVGLAFSITHDLIEDLVKNQVYIILTESDLAAIMTKIKRSDLLLGEELGVISFNETVFKELLGITVITTDFEKMGQSAAEIILQNKVERIKNPFRLIKRSFL
jgi:DNA-binding transcriptional regulator YhcF (GntR family)